MSSTFPNLPTGAVVVGEFNKSVEQTNQGINQLFKGLNAIYIYPMWAKLILGFFIFMAGGIYVTYSIDRYRTKPEQNVFLSAIAGIILGSLISFSGIVLMGMSAYNLILYYGFGISPLLQLN